MYSLIHSCVQNDIWVLTLSLRNSSHHVVTLSYFFISVPLALTFSPHLLYSLLQSQRQAQCWHSVGTYICWLNEWICTFNDKPVSITDSHFTQGKLRLIRSDLPKATQLVAEIQTWIFQALTHRTILISHIDFIPLLESLKPWEEMGVEAEWKPRKSGLWQVPLGDFRALAASGRCESWLFQRLAYLGLRLEGNV